MSGKASDEHSSADNWTDAILAIAEVGTWTIVPTSPVYCSTGTATHLTDPTSYTIHAIDSKTLPKTALIRYQYDLAATAVAFATPVPIQFTTYADGPGCANLLTTTALSTVLRATALQAVEATTETIISARPIGSPIQGAVAAAYITKVDIEHTDAVTTTDIILTSTTTPLSATTAIRCQMPACGGEGRFLRRIPP
ncbi:hypothetical protein SprV_0200613100 [Sparganum proliferum]